MIISTLIAKGVRKLRLTGGEPLVRRNVMSLIRSLSRHLGTGALKELTLTTNGSQLARFANELKDCGVRRINVSLDTLDPAQRFREITRWGDIQKVMAGIDAAQTAGLAVKINAVALRNTERGRNSISDGMGAHQESIALNFHRSHADGRYRRVPRRSVPAAIHAARSAREGQYTLTDLDDSTGGPPATFGSVKPAASLASSRR